MGSKGQIITAAEAWISKLKESDLSNPEKREMLKTIGVKVVEAFSYLEEPAKDNQQSSSGAAANSADVSVETSPVVAESAPVAPLDVSWEGPEDPPDAVDDTEFVENDGEDLESF